VAAFPASPPRADGGRARVNSSRLIQALRSPFSGPTTTGPRASALPPDLLREARRRLGVLARLLMALALINLTLGHTLFPRLHVGWPVVADLVVVGVAVLSLGVFLYTRHAHTHAASFVTLGLVYEVAVVAAVATVEHASIAAESMSAGPTVSRVCLVILIFAAIVPSTPSRSEEHTSELQSRSDLVCRLLLEKKNVGFAGDPAFVAGDIVHAI